MQRKRTSKPHNFHVGSERDEEAERFWEQHPDLRPTPEADLISLEEQAIEPVQYEEEEDLGEQVEWTPEQYAKLLAWLGKGYDAWTLDREGKPNYAGTRLNSDESFATFFSGIGLSNREIAMIFNKRAYHVGKQLFRAKEKKEARDTRVTQKSMVKSKRRGE